jgi:hypothetical protein
MRRRGGGGGGLAYLRGSRRMCQSLGRWADIRVGRSPNALHRGRERCQHVPREEPKLPRRRDRALTFPNLVRRVPGGFEHGGEQGQAQVQPLFTREPRQLLPDTVARVAARLRTRTSRQRLSPTRTYTAPTAPHHQHSTCRGAESVDVVVGEQPPFICHQSIHERRLRFRLSSERLGEAHIVESQVAGAGSVPAG